MSIFQYVTVAVAFLVTACSTFAIGLVVAPHALIGSITSQSEVRATLNAPTERASLTSPSSTLLGSKPEVSAQGSIDVADREGIWLEVVDAVNMRRGASSAEPLIKVQPEGTQLHVVSRDGNWIHVVEPESGLQGWVYKKYVQLAKPAELQSARVDYATAD